MIILLAALLVFSAAYNFYTLLQVRKYRASLKYMEYEFKRFATDAEARITSHEAMIKDTREEIKALDAESAQELPFAKGQLLSEVKGR